jgi:hypothetical protein
MSLVKYTRSRPLPRPLRETRAIVAPLIEDTRESKPQASVRLFVRLREEDFNGRQDARFL